MQMSKFYQPSSEGGTVTGVGGEGGSVGTSVGLTTAKENTDKCTRLTGKDYTVIGEEIHFTILSDISVTGKCDLTCPLLDAHSGPLQVGGLDVHGGIVERVGGQAVEAVAAFRASDSDFLSSSLGGWRRETNPRQTDPACSNSKYLLSDSTLTVKRIDFESVGGGCSVRGPADAEIVVANVVSGQVCHVQVHWRDACRVAISTYMYFSFGWLNTF